MRAAILSIGSELLEGYLTDTNATFLAQELNALGVELVGVSQVGDNLPRIVTAFRRALEDADLVIATGGIGPTEDDLTREAIAEIRGESPHPDPQLVEGIRRFFSARGITMPEQNVKQAWVVPSSTTLANPMGTAPGWFVRHGEQMIVAMPGVPREMYRMWQDQAVPRILERLASRAIVSRTLKTIGIGESALEQEIIDIVKRGRPTVATYAKDDGVHVRITATAESQLVAEREVALAEDEIRARIGEFVYGYLEDSIAGAILAPIAAAGERLALWEAGNAGRLTSLLQDAPEADTTVVGARSTSFDTAADALGNPGSPAELAGACAAAAAHAHGTAFGASVAVRLTPGDIPDRARGEIGLALWRNGELLTREHRLSAVTPEIRRRATMWASDFLWSAIRDATAARPD